MPFYNVGTKTQERGSYCRFQAAKVKDAIQGWQGCGNVSGRALRVGAGCGSVDCGRGGLEVVKLREVSYSGGY